MQGGFDLVSQKVSPAVDNISTVKTIKGGGLGLRNFNKQPYGDDNPFNYLFAHFLGDDKQREDKLRSLGAGLIIMRGSNVEGLTTAAGLWASAGVGIAVGMGLYGFAGFVAGLIISVFYLL